MSGGRAAWALALALACGPAAAQEVPHGPEPGDAQEAAPARPAWSFSAEAYLYLKEDGDILVPLVRADHGPLHLEARYQYEGKKTFSAWVGWTFETGESLHLSVVPMLGGLVGDTKGVAPGLEWLLTWKSLDLYSESEYVIDAGGREGDFFYNWTELGWHATPWLTLGPALQRTRLYDSGRAVDWGVFAGFTAGRVTLKVYGFDLDTGGRLGVLSLVVGF